MKTIIQTIGPLYGDYANGTVFGQPNGSVYTPPANALILLQDKSECAYIQNDSLTNRITTCESDGTTNNCLLFQVQAQVGTWKYKTELATDSSFATVVSSGTFLRNDSSFYVGLFGLNSEYTVVNGTTYYARATLLTQTGDVMAISDTFTFEGVA